jgi:hypothetical protein
MKGGDVEMNEHPEFPPPKVLPQASGRSGLLGKRGRCEDKNKQEDRLLSIHVAPFLVGFNATIVLPWAIVLEQTTAAKLATVSISF